MLVSLVVLVVPCGAAALTAVAGNRHQPVAAFLLPVLALPKLCMARCATPVALDAGAGLAQLGFFLFGRGLGFWGHGAGMGIR